MRTKTITALAFALTLLIVGLAGSPGANAESQGVPQRPKGPCDIYAAAGNPCVAAHSTTRALFASYNGRLYQVLRQSDGKTLDIGVGQPSASPTPDAGGYADAAAQDRFCANTYCWISKVYDQSSKHNDLTQAPRGGFSGPAMGGFNNLPIADMAPIEIMGHKAYGVFIAPRMGLRQNDAKGTAVDDQAEGQYWVINGLHFNSGCCFDYGNAEIDSRDDDNGTMETTYYGDATPWYHGNPPGPWVMTDQENNLVGCVNPDGSKLCVNLPKITWRFVTAIAKGEPHHWTSMGGNAQDGTLSVMFDGPRINSTYDPMRKQGAILLGNGGDNSNGSQGTFYEGAMTASGTFPTNATDQLVQANVVAARYEKVRLSLAPAMAVDAPPGLQTFSPGASQETVVTFANTTGAPVTALKLSIVLPNKQWTSFAQGSTQASKIFAESIAPGAAVSATFHITSGSSAYNGDLVASASWTNAQSHETEVETAVEKIRNLEPVKVNEFRISGSAANTTDSFIELYNAGAKPVDISSWTLTEHPAQQAVFSTVKIPSGTRLPSKGFYLFGLSNSGLAVSTRTGESTIYVRSTDGMSIGDTLTIGNGSESETRKIARLGTAASNHTTLWQPVPDGPVITIPAGSKNVPVESASGFVAGEKIALGFGASYPVTGLGLEKYEVATVTAVGKPGTQAYLATDAPAGATNLQVTSTADITVGDKIRLDIDTVGHGIESVTVAKVGTAATHTNLSADTNAGATNIKVRNVRGFSAGEKIIIGTPANSETVTVAAVGTQGQTGSGIDFKPALSHAHGNDEGVVAPGTGLDLAEPLKFSHAANLPFSNRGTGISFEPASAFPHASNEPVQALGTGVTLDRPLSHDHSINAVVRDTSVTSAGYQGKPEPDQWFGGPELVTRSLQFGRTITVREGSLVLRNTQGLVVDSVNYGGLVDPWAVEGYQGRSGAEQSGCHAPAPGPAGGFGTPVGLTADSSAGRFPDGADTDSNCDDFFTQATANFSADSAVGATNIKVSRVGGFHPGTTIAVGSGESLERAVIATVGTAGATTSNAAIAAGATIIPVANTSGFTVGENVTLDKGSNVETVVIASIHRFGDSSIVVKTPLTLGHSAGVPISGSGITLSNALTRSHEVGAQITDDIPTPGGANHYSHK